MDAVNYFKVFRKFFLSAVSFWLFFALDRAAYALCVTIYADADTQFVGLHPSINIVYPILVLLLLIPYSFDCYVGDREETERYIESVDFTEFTLKGELLRSYKTIEFITARLTWALFGIIVFKLYAVIIFLAINTKDTFFRSYLLFLYVHL